MKFRKAIKIAILVIVSLIVIGLVIWTVTSPSPLPVQSKGQLQSGLFGFSKDVASYNISDGSGSYSFEFGLDYSQNLTSGSPTRIEVYCALVNQQVTSIFTRGVALALQSSSLFIDGTVDNSIDVSSKLISNLQTYSFVIPNLSSPLGNHTIQIRILVSTIDVNYIGSSTGTYQPVLLNGTFTLVS
ncbi:MAG: hypothetical protein PXY39_04175 [archaeon]|nr:hypothetical protein [archaeon]